MVCWWMSKRGDDGGELEAIVSVFFFFLHRIVFYFISCRYECRCMGNMKREKYRASAVVIIRGCALCRHDTGDRRFVC